MRNLARLGISNSGSPNFFQESSALSMVSFGGRENVPGSLFEVASQMTLLAMVLGDVGENTEGSRQMGPGLIR